MSKPMIIDRDESLSMLKQISRYCAKPYHRRVSVMFFDDDRIETKYGTSALGFNLAYIGFGAKSYMEKPKDCTMDEFVWVAHELIHEFGHANQRINLFNKHNDNSILMAQQQTLCIAFPKYNKSSYHSQLVEIDAERYAWQKTVKVLSDMYPDLFTEDDVKQSLVNGLYKYQGTWYANKNFSTWEDGLKNLNEAFEQAKYKTWDVHTGNFRAGADNSFAEQFESNHRVFEEYLHTFGSERNDLLFRYCVANNMVDTLKFSCLKKEVKAIKRGMRRLPDMSDMPCDMEDSKDKDGPDL